MRIVLVFSLVWLSFGCSHKEKYHQIKGETMGTYYLITGQMEHPDRLKMQIDSVLNVILEETSTYIPRSTISLINQADTIFEVTKKTHFLYNYVAALEIYKKSEGYFDPSIMPLVNYWGFGYTEKKLVQSIDSSAIEAILPSIGFDKFELVSNRQSYHIRKPITNSELDFSAIAKGYAVDELANVLSNNGSKNYLIDIGGEVKARGVNEKAEIWRLGINTPKEEATPADILAAIRLENKAMATSGNYRNYYEYEGNKYSHTINPFTGFPERSNLLSATVLAKNCIIADANATACMAMGLDKAWQYCKNNEQIECYFIYSDLTDTLKTKYTNGFDSILLQ